MKRYEEYKESGVKWIGKVPSHWNYSRIKFGLKSSFSGVWGYDEKGNQNDVVCYRVADFDYKNGGLSEEKITIRNIDGNTFKEREVHPNDILIEKSGGGDVNPVGRAVIVNLAHKATCSNFIHCVRCNDNILNYRLLYYYFYSIYAQKVNLLFFNQTTGIQNLKIPDYLGQIIFLPPLSEQQSIASFLDGKTKPIDAIISKREKQIELLEEMKSAIISRAVTKGLNPDAKMKDSGVEWIGEVPEEWDIVRLKHLASLFGRIGYRGYTQNDIVPQGDGAITISPSNMVNGHMDFEKCTYLSWEKYNESPEIMIQNDNILLVKTGSTYGKVAIVKDLPSEATINPQIVVIKKIKCNANLLNYILGTPYVHFQVENTVIGSTIPTISQEKINNYVLAIPPADEQHAITSYLDTETSKIDTRIAKRRRQIELLQEYKQALITDAVTGKIDVRGFNA